MTAYLKFYQKEKEKEKKEFQGQLKCKETHRK